MTWVELRKNGQFLRYLPEIWRREQEMPAWYQASSWLWTPTFEAYVRWAASMQEIHGLFENGKFMGCVYIERQESPRIVVIHFSAALKIEPDVFIRKCAELRNMRFHMGVKYIRGWVLKKNFVLGRLMAGIGFRPTGLVMDHGASHGRVMRWELMEIAAG